MISGPLQAILFTVITWNPESNCTCREKNHFLVPIKYSDDQGCKYILGCDAGESIGDYWNVDGDRESSDTWTGFTRFTILDEKTTGWIYMVR